MSKIKKFDWLTKNGTNSKKIDKVQEKIQMNYVKVFDLLNEIKKR